MGIKQIVQDHLGPANYKRAKILHTAWSNLRKTFNTPKLYPISPDEIESTLKLMGITPGDTVLVHSSTSHLMKGSSTPSRDPAGSLLDYAQQVITLLKRLVGPEGTLMMNTDAIQKPWLFSAHGEVFDAEQAYTRRGVIPSLFLKQDGIVRSLHPIYNVAAWGKRAAELVQDHEKSTPFTMDKYSPWYRLGDMGGKVILLGCGFESNSLLHLVEQAHDSEYPKAVYLHKPCRLKYRTKNREIHDMDVMMHAGLPSVDDIERFSSYIQTKYGIYKIQSYAAANIITYKAKDQYDAMLREMKNGVTWYDAQFSQHGHA